MIRLPDRYPFAERVPDEGASCASCKYLSKDGKACRNKFYIEEHGGRDLGDVAWHWCCAAWTPEGGRQ